MIELTSVIAVTHDKVVYHRDLLFQFGNLCLQQLFCPVIRIYDLAMPFARDAVAHQIEALAEAHSRVCRMQSNV